MGERDKAFRERIARITRIQHLNHKLKEQEKEEETTVQEKKQNNLSEILPAICGVKKSIENFQTKETTEEVRD